MSKPKPSAGAFSSRQEVKSLNDLCSIESGLREFVCKKELVSDYWLAGGMKDDREERFYGTQVSEYRLMKASIQKNKEQFILDRIEI